MAVIHADREFLMGSPVTEAARIAAMSIDDENRHVKQINRTFAIGMREVSIAQFEAFQRTHDFNRAICRKSDAQANMISWYDAAAFCNWLSKQEGLPTEQWCYDPNQSISEGMTLYSDYLHRTGYRLPTEAEWEYACRIGTTTARFYGETDKLLGEYAWYTGTSGDQWMQPIGILKPNTAGLFDMLGNAVEWCHYSFKVFDDKMDDIELSEEISNSKRRVIRGGSYSTYAGMVRSPYRQKYVPDGRNANFGFRMARTYR